MELAENVSGPRHFEKALDARALLALTRLQQQIYWRMITHEASHICIQSFRMTAENSPLLVLQQYEAKLLPAAYGFCKNITQVPCMRKLEFRGSASHGQRPSKEGYNASLTDDLAMANLGCPYAVPSGR